MNFVRPPERMTPPEPRLGHLRCESCEGVVKMGRGGDVQRTADHRARAEVVNVVNVRGDLIHDFLRESAQFLIF